jgi:hypothetical protein
MPTGPSPLTGNASADLGLGTDLANQVNSETEEQRKKRLAQMQQQMSPGAQSLLGASMGMPGG